MPVDILNSIRRNLDEVVSAYASLVEFDDGYPVVTDSTGRRYRVVEVGRDCCVVEDVRSGDRTEVTAERLDDEFDVVRAGGAAS